MLIVVFGSCWCLLVVVYFSTSDYLFSSIAKIFFLKITFPWLITSIRKWWTLSSILLYVRYIYIYIYIYAFDHNQYTSNYNIHKICRILLPLTLVLTRFSSYPPYIQFMLILTSSHSSTRLYSIIINRTTLLSP